MKISLPSPSPSIQCGFSLIETMVTIAVIGVLASVAILAFGSGQEAKVQDAKLSSDVNTLNSLVGLYLGDSGSLSGTLTEQQVLDRLKRARPNSQSLVHSLAGTGRYVDVRLRARSGTGALPTGRSYRAHWNSTKQRFELGTTGTDEFYLDDTLTATAFPLDSRGSSIKEFNGSNGWIWGSVAPSTPLTYVNPNTQNTNGGNNWFNPNDPVPTAATTTTTTTTSGTSTTSGTTTTAPPTALPAPTISPSGGTFNSASFPSTVTISRNGAPVGLSDLKYKINGGSWQIYTVPVTISSGDRITAQNVTTNPALRTDGPTVAQDYYKLVDGFTGNGTGNWNSVAGGPTLVSNSTNGDPTSTLSHGNTQLDLGNGNFLDAGVENTLTYTKNNFSNISPNVPFKLGELVMLNGTTFYNSEATGATLSLNLNFSSPAVTTTANMMLNFINTENSTDRFASADIVQFANPNSVTTVTIDNVTYTLKVEWVTLDPSSGVVQGDKFLIFEGASARAEIRATLVSNH